jgi:8-oxo-dGTP diphosphatase
MEAVPSIWLTVDAVVFGCRPGRQLSVLLIRRAIPPYAGCWALPGGFVREGESLEAAVQRELREETGVSLGYLEQLYTFGAPDRDPRHRVVSVAYYALVRPDQVQLHAGSDAGEAAWFDQDALPPLAFDHGDLIRTALHRLRSKVTYEPVGVELLDEKFPFSDLVALYETLLGAERVDRANLWKKFNGPGLLEALGERRKQPGSGRPAALYRFNRSRYAQLRESGAGFGI